MSKGSLRLWGIGASHEGLSHALTRFGAEGPGKVCALDDSWLAAAQRLVAEDAPLELVSFESVVAGCLAASGGRQVPLADSAIRLEAVRGALERSPVDSPYHASRAMPGVARRLDALLTQLRWSRIDFQFVGELPPAFQPFAIALASLSAELNAKLERLGLELSESRIERCLESHLADGFGIRRLLVLAGADPAPLAIDWMRWAAAEGIELIAVAPKPLDNGGFLRSASLAERLDTTLEADSEFSWPQKLFTTETTMAPIEVSIESAADALSEVEWALRACRQSISNGVSAQEIGLFARHLQVYGPMLEAAAARVGVPLSMARSEPIARTPFGRWISGWLGSLGSASPTAFVEHSLSSYLQGVAPPAARLREAVSGLQGSAAWESLESAAASDADPVWKSVLEWRRSATGARRDRAAWRDALDALFEAGGWTRHEGSTKTRDTHAAEAALASVQRQAKLDDSGLELDFETWLNAATAIWELASALVPASGSGVRVASDPVALLGCRCVHAIGFVEGVFPRRRSEDPILGDEERAAFNACLPPDRRLSDSRSIAGSERDLFLLLCGAARESLAFHYPSSGEDRDNVPAFYLSELERALGDRAPRRYRALDAWAPPAAWSSAPLERELAEALDAPTRAIPPVRVDDPEALAAIRAAEGEPFTLQEIRDALICPFRYAFARKLEFQPDRGFGLAELALPRIAKLAEAENPVEARARLWEAFETHLRPQLDPPAERIARSTVSTAIDKWVESEFASREIWSRDPGSSLGSTRFDGENLANELPLDDRSTLKLQGGVDDVSHYGPYRVVKLYGARSAFQGSIDNWNPPERMESAILFAALGNDSPGAAIEFVANDGSRRLVLRDRLPNVDVDGDRKRGLEVVSVDAKERRWMSEGKSLIVQAVRAAVEGNAEPNPGDHCEHCTMSELCRRSQFGGEQAFEWEADDGAV